MLLLAATAAAAADTGVAADAADADGHATCACDNRQVLQ